MTMIHAPRDELEREVHLGSAVVVVEREQDAHEPLGSLDLFLSLIRLAANELNLALKAGAPATEVRRLHPCQAVRARSSRRSLRVRPCSSAPQPGCTASAKRCLLLIVLFALSSHVAAPLCCFVRLERRLDLFP